MDYDKNVIIHEGKITSIAITASDCLVLRLTDDNHIEFEVYCNRSDKNISFVATVFANRGKLSFKGTIDDMVDEIIQVTSDGHLWVR